MNFLSVTDLLVKFLCHKCKIDHMTQVKTPLLDKGFAKPCLYMGFTMPLEFLKLPLNRSFVKHLGALQSPFCIRALWILSMYESPTL